jgi:hypothetical protein
MSVKAEEAHPEAEKVDAIIGQQLVFSLLKAILSAPTMPPAAL